MHNNFRLKLAKNDRPSAHLLIRLDITRRTVISCISYKAMPTVQCAYCQKLSYFVVIHHHHVRLFKTMTKCIVTLHKKVNESIGPSKKHAGNKIAVIIITRFSSKCQIVSTSSKVID